MNLESLIQSVGLLGLLAIVFAENGLFFGFFLPGDTLLFTAGFLAARGHFNIWTLTISLIVASILGVFVGFWFGKKYGVRLFTRPDSRFFRRENIDKAHRFYQKYGSFTIVLARFVPIVRTFAPIVAGIADMSYQRFVAYNILGGIIWAGGITLMGYWFGDTIPNIDKYILPVMGVIVVASFAPGLFHLRKKGRNSPAS